LKSEPVFHRERCGLLTLGMMIAVSASLLVSLVLPAVSPAVGLSGDSRTYVESRETQDNAKILGGYEYLDFAVQDIGKETISFHTGGWLRYDLGEAESGSRSNSDLQYSYLSFKGKTDNTVVNLGRVMVFEGVAAERVDGIHARTDLAGGFGVSGFGGSPVETAIDVPGNDAIYGARLSHKAGDVYRIGVSALKEEKNSLDFRREEGVDVWVRPIDKVDLAGRSSYNDITKGWMEHSYVLMLGPFENLRLDTHASAINYDDYFFRATSSAFTLRSGIIQPGEKVRILGETASYAFTEKALITADYRKFSYDIAGKADYYGGMLKYSAAGAGAGIGYHRMQGEADTLRYNEYRAYAYKKLGRLDAAVDVIDVEYDVPRSDVKDAYSGTLAAQYALTDAWKLGADVGYSHNPDFDNDIRAFFKILYHFGAKGGA